MNYFFRRLPLPIKLLLISLIPLLFLIYLFIQLYLEKTQKVMLLQTYLIRIDQSADMAKLIDALRQENRYSYKYALQKNHQAAMLAQRPITDSIISRMQQYKDPALKGFTAYTFLDNLQNVRNSLDSTRIDANGVMHYFTNTIFRLNSLNQLSAGSNVYLRQIYPDLTAQRLLSEMTTYLGILGANVHNVLYTRAYMVETLIGSRGVHEVFHTYEKELQAKAPPQTYAAYQQLLQNTALRPTIQYLDQLFKTFHFDSTYNYAQWEQTYTPALNELRALQQRILYEVEAETTQLYHTEQHRKNQSIIILVIAIAVAIIIVAYTVAVINQMLKELKQAAQKIAKGKSGIRVQKESNDAIGSLAESIIQIDRANKELAKIAEAIGNGDFGTNITPRSPDDHLTHALINMRNNLQKNTSALKEKEKQFRELADFMPQIVWTAQPNGQVDYWNKQWYSFSGLPEEDFENWTQVLHPDDVKNALQTWGRATKTGTDYQIEYRLRDSRTGKYKWFLAKALPSKDKNGAIIKWFGTCTEIHERKTISEKLELLVVERTEELKRSNEDLQQFAHVASHDLKEPLRKVRTFSSRLLEEFGHELPERGKSYLEKINTASERMTNMIDGILHYSTINAVQEAPVRINLNEVVDGIISDLEVVIQQKGATITHDPLPFISGTPVLLHQLFYNLINNSLKFSRPDVPPVVTITCTVQNDACFEGQRPMAGSYTQCYQITVKDNGIGFDPEYSGRMFEIFSRLNSRHQFEGTGLGLALCKKIMHRHHGEIFGEGKENEGASFHLFFPVEEAAG